MRADRLLSILLLLQTNQRLTAGDLARRLEVSERTVYRDMDALSVAGVPVYAERGSGGGWSLLEAYRTDLNGLSEAEAQTLFLANPSRLLTDLGWRQTAETALIKLLAALPGSQRRDAEFVRRRIHIDVTGWRGSNEDVSALPALQEAIWQERKLALTYRRGDGATVERQVEPFGLVAKGSVWYLVAAVEAELRTYRVSRVQAVTMLAERFVRPEAFDLADYWAASKAQFIADLPRYPATLRVDPAILPRLRFSGRFARIEQIDPPEADGWQRVVMQFDTMDEASGYVVGFGSKIEVVEPPELREQVITLAQSVVAFYAATRTY
jgi:predicted DNA-binding transcriptional regulator YafY